MKIFFNLVTPSRITTNGVPKSPEVRFLTVWSSINHFLVHPKLWLWFPCTCSPPTPCIHSTSGQIHIWNLVGSLWRCFFAEVVYMVRLLVVFTEKLHCWCLTGFKMRLCLRRKFPLMGLHRGILNSCCLLILPWFTPNTSTIRWNLGLTSHPHFLEEEPIHLVYKAKNVWLTVGQLPIKSGWWDTLGF